MLGLLWMCGCFLHGAALAFDLLGVGLFKHQYFYTCRKNSMTSHINAEINIQGLNQLLFQCSRTRVTLDHHSTATLISSV